LSKKNSSDLGKANALKAAIVGKDVIIIENASDDGRLYGSVNSAVIATKINEITNQKTVSRLDVFLKKPIKEIGVYQVTLAPHSDITFEVRVIVSRSESEVVALLKSEKKDKKSEGEEVSEEAVEVKSEKRKKAKKAAEDSEEVA